MKSMLVFALLLAACDAQSSHDDGPVAVQLSKSSLARVTDPSADDVAALGGSNRAFAFDLYHQIATTSAGQNVVFSPYSVSTAFAMTYAGARNQTRDQIGAVMHFDLPESQLHVAFNAVERTLSTLDASDELIRITTNNALWMRQGQPIEAPFLDTLAQNYGAGVFLFRGAPEDTRLAINAEIAKETEMLIPALLPTGALDSLTRFVLTDTVYLDAKWQTPFNVAATKDATFTKLDGSSVTASMMRATLLCSYAAGAGYEAVALPYASDLLQFVAVLPDDGNFETLEAGLEPSWFDALNANWSSDAAVISFPKLDFGQHVAMRSELEALGMTNPFELDDADFSGMTSEPVAIKDVFHHATLNVREEGTIASAATGVVINTKSGVPQPAHTVSFDRPFLFAISNSTTGELMFLGRVLDPTAK